MVLIRPLNRTFFLLALVGGGTTSFDHDAALAQTLDRRSDACSGFEYPRTRSGLAGPVAVVLDWTS